MSLQNNSFTSLSRTSTGIQNYTTTLILQTPRHSRNDISPLPLYKFQGVGFSLAKSLKSVKGLGISLKLPITENFPVYAAAHFLPRVGLSIGFNYFPFDYKLSFSSTLPVQTASYG